MTDAREHGIADRAWFEYLEMGLRYHIAARFLLTNGGGTVTGNLAHHAVEMYLKGVLCRHTSEGERKSLSHRLLKLWERAKALLPVEADRLDEPIRSLDVFEAIRYPEVIFRRGMSAEIGWERTDTGPVLLGGKPSSAPRYCLFMDEVDELADLLLTAAGAGPRAMKGRLRPTLFEQLSVRNSHMRFWSSEE